MRLLRSLLLLLSGIGGGIFHETVDGGRMLTERLPESLESGVDLRRISRPDGRKSLSIQHPPELPRRRLNRAEQRRLQLTGEFVRAPIGVPLRVTGARGLDRLQDRIEIALRKSRLKRQSIGSRQEEGRWQDVGLKISPGNNAIVVFAANS